MRTGRIPSGSSSEGGFLFAPNARQPSARRHDTATHGGEPGSGDLARSVKIDATFVESVNPSNGFQGARTTIVDFPEKTPGFPLNPGDRSLMDLGLARGARV